MTLVRDISDMTFSNVVCLLRNQSALEFKSRGFKVLHGGNLAEPIWNAIAASGQPLLDTHPALCHGGKCSQVLDGEMIMGNRNHLNERLSRKVQQQLYDGWFASDRQATATADGTKGGARDERELGNE